MFYVVGASGTSDTSQLAYNGLWVLGLFVFVLMHELSHCFVARRLGLTVRDVTLLPIGGVSAIEGMDVSPSVEAKVAIAGPAASLAIGGILVGLGYLAGGAISANSLSVDVSTLSGWLISFGLLNLVLAAFNLIPALPMDGGRVFRSLLERFGNRVRATAIASSVAAAIGIAMVGYELSGHGNDPFLILIGIFVIYGAWSEWRNAKLRSAIETLLVGALMYPDATTIDSSVASGEVAGWLMHFPGRAVPIVDSVGRYVGIASLSDLNGRDPHAPVGTLCDRTAPVLTPEMSVYPKVMEALQRRRELAVGSGGRIVGVLYLPAVATAVAQARAA